MASIYLPTPTAEVLVPERTHRLVRPVVALLLVAAVAVGAASGLRWVADALTASSTAVPHPVAQAVIHPGNGPAVAATVRGRILSLECTLAGPIEVAEDGTGAYVVASGADNVRCPHGQFREGFSLRWPARHPVTTAPLGSG
jgi:hypothetical protein